MAFVTEQGYAIAEAARSPDIGANILDRWKREYEALYHNSTRLHSTVDYPLRTSAIEVVLALACAVLMPKPVREAAAGRGDKADEPA